MSNHAKIALGLFVAVIVLTLIVGTRHYNQLVRALPPKTVCASQAEAFAATGFKGIGVLGTGSMQPYIRAAKKGEDPLKTIVAYAVADSKPFKAISTGDLVVYHAEWAHGLVMHQAVKETARGWLMGGLNNKLLEVNYPLTEANFRFIVKGVFTW